MAETTKTPLISIIVPVYNVEGQIERCVNSILAQTVKSFEIILVDDGSKDQSLSICRTLAEKDHRIVVISKENEGAGAARNAGMELAKGKLFYFIDSDDWIEPTLLEKLLANIDLEDDGTMAVCARFSENNSGSRRREWFPIVEGRVWNEDNIPDCIANLEEANVFNYLWDRIYFRSVIERNNIKFDNWFTTGQDLDFNIQYFPFVKRCKVIMEPLYHYVHVSDDPESLCLRYKSRMYEIISELCNRRAMLHQKMKMTTDPHYELILAQQCVSHMHAVVPNMYRTNAPLSRSERRQVFQRLMDNESLCKYLHRTTWSDPLMKLFQRVVLRRNAWLAEREYAGLFFFRNHTKKLYRYLKQSTRPR